jgi:hypothetical protein
VFDICVQILFRCYVSLALMKQLTAKEVTLYGDTLPLEENEEKGINATRELLLMTPLRWVLVSMCLVLVNFI